MFLKINVSNYFFKKNIFKIILTLGILFLLNFLFYFFLTDKIFTFNYRQNYYFVFSNFILNSQFFLFILFFVFFLNREQIVHFKLKSELSFILDIFVFALFALYFYMFNIIASLVSVKLFLVFFFSSIAIICLLFTCYLFFNINLKHINGLIYLISILFILDYFILIFKNYWFFLVINNVLNLIETIFHLTLYIFLLRNDIFRKINNFYCLIVIFSIYITFIMLFLNLLSFTTL
jgi:hypothetical protein